MGQTEFTMPRLHPADVLLNSALGCIQSETKGRGIEAIYLRPMMYPQMEKSDQVPPGLRSVLAPVLK